MHMYFYFGNNVGRHPRLIPELAALVLTALEIASTLFKALSKVLILLIGTNYFIKQSVQVNFSEILTILKFVK